MKVHRTTLFLVLLTSCFYALNAATAAELLPEVPADAQALSLQGEPLFAAEPNAGIVANLEAARVDYMADPNTAENIIWYGRRIAWVVGAFCVFYPNLNEELDFLSGQVILPIGGILIAVFAGWIAPREVMRKELSGLSETLFSVWRYIVRYIAPLLVGGVLILGVSARF